MNTADLHNLAAELRVVVDRQLDDAEIQKGLREAATNKGIDWSQLKALVRAQAQDARDDGHRVGKLVERADFASAYADILSNMNEQRVSRSSSPTEPRIAPQPVTDAISSSDEHKDGIPDFLRRAPDNKLLVAS